MRRLFLGGLIRKGEHGVVAERERERETEKEREREKERESESASFHSLDSLHPCVASKLEAFRVYTSGCSWRVRCLEPIKP